MVSLGAAPPPLQPGQRWAKQRAVMAVGPSGDQMQWHAGGVGQGRAFEPLFASIHRASPRRLASTRRFRDAAVDGHIVQLQPDHPVILRQHQRVELLGQARCSPFVHPASNRPIRTAR